MSNMTYRRTSSDNTPKYEYWAKLQLTMNHTCYELNYSTDLTLR